MSKILLVDEGVVMEPEVLNLYERFEEVILRELNEEGQYVSRFTDGSLGCPNLGEGIRFIGSSAQWDRLLIHRDDIEEFVGRYREYKQKRIEELKRALEGV
jgi:hypothetical protein